MGRIATKVTLYIGGDNKTHKINEVYQKKIEEILSKYWKNFTLIKSRGCYEGQVEESIEAIIIVLNLIFKNLEDCINELKVKLVQDTIGLEITANVDFKLK